MRADTMAAETHGLVWPSVPMAGDNVTVRDKQSEYVEHKGSDVLNPFDAFIPVPVAHMGPAVPATGRVEPGFDSSVLSTQFNTPERDVSYGTGSSVGEQSCCHRETQVWDGLEDTNRRCDWQ